MQSSRRSVKDTVISIRQLVAKEVNRSVAQVLLRWHLQTGWVIIPKSIKPHRIAENFDVHDFELTKAQMERIDSLDRYQRVGPDPDDFDI
nr:aldo/keto reductase [Exiguobacterium sp. MER 193]